MKTEEDEAFDDLARRQGMWGGGYQAKRQMAADKLQEEDWDVIAEKQLASIKRDTQASFEDAMVRATHKVMAELEEPAHCQCPACKDGVLHASDCAVHTGPAYSLGPCDCGAIQLLCKEDT